MRETVIKFFDKIIVFLLGFSGVFSACDIYGPVEYGPFVEYGMPHADYKLKGVITDKETSSSIENIRVIRHTNSEWIMNDTVYTDAEGKYAFEFVDFPPLPEKGLLLKVEDIDGEENGGFFESKEIDVDFTQVEKVEKGDGRWYAGKFVITKNIELNRIDVHPEYGVFPATFKP